jgi:ribosomal protein S18 acetylase RimI-like enzyme
LLKITSKLIKEIAEAIDGTVSAQNLLNSFRKIKMIDYTKEMKEKYNTNWDQSDCNDGYDGYIYIDKFDKVACSILVHIPSKWISNLRVDEKYQRQGLGTILLNMAVNEFKVMYLGVNKDNKGAQRFYLRNGWVFDGTHGTQYKMKYVGIKK